MYTIPPDLNLCNIHRQAQFMKKQKTDNPTEDDICHCCGNVYVVYIYIIKYIFRPPMSIPCAKILRCSHFMALESQLILD